MHVTTVRSQRVHKGPVQDLRLHTSMIFEYQTNYCSFTLRRVCNS